MKYRAKCTWCISHVMNTYNICKNPILKDATEHYIEVDSEHEADLIEELNTEMKVVSKIYTELVNINSNKR